MPSPKTSAPGKSKTQVEVVDPIWLIKAIAFSLAAALVCGYATLCLLYYQGAWQLLLHPSQTVDRTPASINIPYTEVHFDTSENGQPRLTAWWIPAQPQGGFATKYGAFTVLYLHDGSGSLADSVPALARLHTIGLNVFAIDYRGFGASDASAHPSANRMAEDSAAALVYLNSTRHLPASNIIPYGTGLGASLAVDLARAHPDLPVVILDNPDPDPQATAASHSSRFIPIRWLIGHPFDIAESVTSLTAPKLLIAGGPNASSRNASNLQVTLHPASPTFSVTLPSAANEDDYQATLTRFLDQYLVIRH